MERGAEIELTGETGPTLLSQATARGQTGIVIGNGVKVDLSTLGLAGAEAPLGQPLGLGSLETPRFSPIVDAGAAESGFSQAELGVIGEAKSIVTSPQMADLAAAHSAGESMTVNIGGRLVQYEPGLPASGMTMFGENGFLMGPEAFSSSLEQNQTVLHELYRLNFSNSAGGVSADLAAQETKAAADFAARAAKHLP